MMRIREVLHPWWVAGLAGAAANFVLLAPGMGIALGALPVGLVLGLWIGRKARQLAQGDGETARRLALWGGLIAGGMAMHAEMLYGLTLLLLFGPAEMGRAFTPELYGPFPWLRGCWPSALDSIGAFWILQTFGFALTGYTLAALTAWLWARRRATDGRKATTD